MQRVIFISLFVLLLIGSGASVQAHELLPKEVVRYIQQHPQATPDELRAFALTQSPEVAQKFSNSSTEKILSIVQNQHTSFFDNAWDFLKLGVLHILSGPDHVLFVLSLLLVFVSISEIVKLATTFTVAHSITLVLAGTGILLLPAIVVEPLIALSIAVMALTSVFFRESPWMKKHWGKIVLVFCFGLFHGLGFAGLLRDIAIPDDKFVSSLFAFNIGIEIGQLIVIGCAMPFILYFRHTAWYSRAIQVFAVFISLLALLWFVQRLLGVG